jgi:hypothetical protein
MMRAQEVPTMADEPKTCPSPLGLAEARLAQMSHAAG